MATRISPIAGTPAPLSSLVDIAKVAKNRLVGVHHIDNRWNVCSRFFPHLDARQLLARRLPSGKFSMGSQTLAVIGATFGDGRTGFYLLANESGESARKIVSAEALLDDKCAN